MTLTFTNPKLQKLIDDRVRSGRYASAEAVVAAALSSLEQQEQGGYFAPGELSGLIATGRTELDRGESIDAKEVFAEIDTLRDRAMQGPA